MSTLLTAPQDESDTSAQTRAALREFHWTVEQFYRAGDIGAFDEPLNVELVRGKLIEHSGQSPRHFYTAACLAERMRNALTPRLNVQELRPLHFAPDTETDTDFLVLERDKTDDRERHPSPDDVALPVEVASSSVAGDLGEKALLYAEAGLADYWVVLPGAKPIVVHRDRSPGGYADVTTPGIGDTITPLAASDTSLPVAGLLGEVLES